MVEGVERTFGWMIRWRMAEGTSARGGLAVFGTKVFEGTCNVAKLVERTMKENPAQDWPGKADGVPRPPTADELDEVSRQQVLITDEWGSEPPPERPPGPNAPEATDKV